MSEPRKPCIPPMTVGLLPFKACWSCGKPATVSIRPLALNFHRFYCHDCARRIWLRWSLPSVFVWLVVLLIFGGVSLALAAGGSVKKDNLVAFVICLGLAIVSVIGVLVTTFKSFWGKIERDRVEEYVAWDAKRSGEYRDAGDSFFGGMAYEEYRRYNS